MKDFKMLLKYFRGYTTQYVFAIIFTAFSIVFSRLVPVIVKFTIDNVIGGKVPNSGFWLYVYNLFGGKNYLEENLWVIGIVLLIFSFLNGLFSFLREKLAGQTSESIVKNLRDDLYNVILKAKYDFYSNFQSGDVIQRCTSDVETVRRFLYVDAISVWRIVFMIIFVLYVMINLNLKMTIISSAVIPLLTGTAFWFFLMVKKHFEKVDEAEASVTAAVQENITGVRVVKAFTREGYEIQKFIKKNSEYRELDLKLLALFAKFWTISDFLALTQFALVVVLGSYYAIREEITIGTLVAFTTYVGMLLWPVRELGIILSNFGKVRVSLKRINEILSYELEDLFCDSEFELKGDIEFKDVWFGYNPERPVLKGVSFEIRKGETVAFFGGTGSGKSTIISLLMRLYEPNSGKIMIDGKEISLIPKVVLRRNIGLVPQEAFLFSETVKENISVTNPEASHEEIVSSAVSAAVHDDIMQLEKGYDTLVGEKGVTLSGGQRQRITIARTFLREYPILIFDDSMSAVDTDTEKQIIQAIKQRSKNATTIIVSHRISSIKEADKIIVLENGIITNIGRHEELVNQPGLYQKVWKIESLLKNFKE
ncbi:MAG: ABC transporter ATP-binding protein [Fervidobacterium sp.]